MPGDGHCGVIDDLLQHGLSAPPAPAGHMEERHEDDSATQLTTGDSVPIDGHWDVRPRHHPRGGQNLDDHWFQQLRGRRFTDGGVNTYVAADGTIRLINLNDLNGDGNMDLLIACRQDCDETVDLFIYWSDGQGFTRDRRSQLPTEGAVASAAADLNRDGFVDLIVANNFDGEKTRLDCYIYWGGPEGFRPSSRALLPADGPHYLTLADIGHAYDRSDRYDYISPPFDTGPKARLRTISWKGETPFRTRLEFQVRTASTREA